MTPIRASIVGPPFVATRIKACIAACRSGALVLGLRRLRDVFAGILERDELAAAGKRDRFVDATYLAATLPLMHGAAIISIAAFSGFAIVYAPTLARPVRTHPLGEGILYSGLRTDRSGAGNVEGMSSVVSRYRRPPGIGTLSLRSPSTSGRDHRQRCRLLFEP
jgi:hypothetical protein